jgi:hypothetical protein
MLVVWRDAFTVFGKATSRPTIPRQGEIIMRFLSIYKTTERSVPPSQKEWPKWVSWWRRG